MRTHNVGPPFGEFPLFWVQICKTSEHSRQAWTKNDKNVPKNPHMPETFASATKTAPTTEAEGQRENAQKLGQIRAQLP